MKGPHLNKKLIHFNLNPEHACFFSFDNAISFLRFQKYRAHTQRLPILSTHSHTHVCHEFVWIETDNVTSAFTNRCVFFRPRVYAKIASLRRSTVDNVF